MPRTWLVKQEPKKYSFEKLLAERRTVWDGVRNFQARNNLQAMRTGDAVLFYHSNAGEETGVVGLCRVTREASPDPTSDDPRWVVVELAAERRLDHLVSLARIKADPALAEIALIRQSRLSVMPLTKAEFDRIVKLSAKPG